MLEHTEGNHQKKMKKSHSDQHFPPTSSSSSGTRRTEGMIPLGSTPQQTQQIIPNPTLINPQIPPNQIPPSYPNIQPRTSNLLPPTHPQQQQVNSFDQQHHPQQHLGVNLPPSGVSNPFLQQSVQQYNTFYVAPGSTGSSHGMVSRSSDSSLQSGGYPMMTQSNTTNGAFSIQNAMNFFNSTVTKYVNLVQLANNDDRRRALKVVNGMFMCSL